MWNKRQDTESSGVKKYSYFPDSPDNIENTASTLCYIQCTVGGDWVVENLHYKSDLTISNCKTGVISATGVIATSKRSQNLRTGYNVIFRY